MLKTTGKMYFISLLVIAIALHLISTDKKSSANIPINNSDASNSAAKDLIRIHMKQMEIPGMQLSVMSYGRLVLSESFGFSDLEKKTPVTSQTRFRIGSISKSFTGAALGLLMQGKKISLDSSVNFYVPSFPRKKWPITIKQLAGHTSGIRHYNSVEEASSTKHYNTVSESLNQFSKDSLLFKPGTKFFYSSYGYVLLSAAIESASGQSFPEFMNEKIFRALGLEHTSMDYADKEIPDRSKFYVTDDNDKRIEAPFIDNSNKWAAGGMLSTTEDLVKFGNSLLNNSFLEPDIVKTLFESMKTDDGEETGNGIGWEIRNDAVNRKVICMDGSLPSARSILLIYPKQQLVLAILANTGTSVFLNREEAMMIADLFLDTNGFTPTLQERNNAIGKYSYSTIMEQESIDGEINIFDKESKLQGTITIPNGFFKNRIIPAPVVRVVDNSISIIGLPGNWISMTFTNSKNAIHGTWRFGPFNGELSGNLKK